MTRKEQDKLWAELSEESREQMKERYNKPIEDSDPNAEYYRGIRYQTGLMFGKHNLQPSLTYGDVIKELFKNGAWQVAGRGYQREFVFNEGANDHYFLNCASEEQGQKLLAINRLLNVAKFLNKNKDGSDWVPDWKDTHEGKYYPFIDDDGLQSAITEEMNHSIVYFRTDELFDKAVQILGEDVVRTALTTDY